MKYLLFGSLFFFLFIACSPSKTLLKGEKMEIPFWSLELMDTVKKNDFRLTFTTKKSCITGIYIVKQIDGTWKGSIINEFGLKILDFVSTPEKCELINVIPFLSKSYVRKVIASDIQYIMQIDNPAYKMGVQANRYWNRDTLVVNYKNTKELQRLSNGEIMYQNHQHTLTYSLTKIENTTNTSLAPKHTSP
jgi:hypothetical protein